MAMRVGRNRNGKPFVFYIIMIAAVVFSIVFVMKLPVIAPFKVLIACAMILGLSFGGIFLYTKMAKK